MENKYEAMKKDVCRLDIYDDKQCLTYYIPLVFMEEVQKFTWTIEDNLLTPVANELHDDGLPVSLNNITPFMIDIDDYELRVGFRNNDNAKDFARKLVFYDDSRVALKELMRLSKVALSQEKGVCRISGIERRRRNF